ncbi:hypothetical protein ACP43V_09320 [Vibrio genomosp. F10 str. 9ZC157]|nr:hypothetical protein [Vibrio genomosp. F10]
MKLTLKSNGLFLVIAMGLLVITLPELLTDPSGGIKDFKYSYLSYFYGASITLSAMYFSLVGLTFALVFKGSSLLNGASLPFHSVFLGQAIIFTYVYIRSAINFYIIHIPITHFEFIGLIFLCFVFIRCKFGISNVYTSILKDKWNWILSFFIFFLVCVGISEHEIPRQVMLSSDPDQHAFFAKQIERFGTIPYHQFYWGEESFNYPAGTGVLGFIWSFLTGIDVRNAFTIQPLLQAYIAIFIITEMVLVEKKSLKVLAILKLGLISAFGLFLTYSLTKNYYHLEGAGRLASISICAFATSCFFWSKRNVGLLEKKDILSSVLLYLLVVFLGTVINPVNIVYLGVIFGFSILMQCGRKFNFYPIVFLLLLFPIFLILDPYYFSLIFSQGGQLYDPIVITHVPLDMSISEFISQFILSFKIMTKNFGDDFFSFHLISGKFSYLVLLLTLVFSFVLISDKSRNELSEIIIFFIVLIICWVIFSAVFDILKSGSSFRLLGPYFQFSKYQYLYVILCFVFALFIERITRMELNNFKLLALVTFFIVSSSLFGRNVSDNLDSRRVNYCGSIGCATSNDLSVLSYSEDLFKQVKVQSKLDSEVPKILIPNIPLYLNTEKWLFPVGGSRVLPFVDSFPVAFFYGQGSTEYSYENYIENVCEDFNLVWMKENNIQYLFKPEQMLSACVNGLDEVKKKSKVLSEKGEAYLIKLY